MKALIRSTLVSFALLAAFPAWGTQVFHKTVTIDGLEIFYREAGRKEAPTVVLLHGFPTSSHMFRNLIPKLADRYHVIAPDYPGFGQSAMPKVTEFEYSFDNLARVIEKFLAAVGVEKYSLYLQDYGGPVGFRIASAHPERVQALIVQNANAYEEGLRDFWKPLRAYWSEKSEKNAEPLRGFLTRDATIWQYTVGVRDKASISPDNWTHDAALLSRPGNDEIQLALFYSYGTNPPLYPSWQAYFRKHQPPTLVVWGKNDPIFPAEGALPYRRDLKKIDFNLIDTGHFALEEEGDLIAGKIRGFLAKHIRQNAKTLKTSSLR